MNEDEFELLLERLKHKMFRTTSTVILLCSSDGSPAKVLRPGSFDRLFYELYGF